MWSLEFNNENEAFLIINGRRAMDPFTYKDFERITEVGIGRSAGELWLKFENAQNGKRVLRTDFSPLHDCGVELLDAMNNSQFIEKLCQLAKVSSRKTLKNRNKTTKRKFTEEVEVNAKDGIELSAADAEIEENSLGQFEIHVGWLTETPKEYRCRELKTEWVQTIKKHITLQPSPAVTIIPALIHPDDVQSREQFDLEKLNSYRIFALGGNHLVDALKEIVRDNDDQKELELVQVKLYYGLNNLQAKRVANSHNSKMSTLQLTFQDKVYQARQIYESDPDKLHSDLLTTLGEIEQKEMNADSLSTIKNIASYTGRCWNEFTCLVESFERDNGCSKNIQQKLFRSIQGMNEEMKYRALRKANEESLTASINWVERTKKQQILRDTFCHQVNAPSWEDAQNLYPEHSSQLDKFLSTGKLLAYYKHGGKEARVKIFLAHCKGKCYLTHTEESELTIKVQGPRPDNVLFMVHEVFEGLIMESFQGVSYDFFVPCPDCQRSVLKDPHMFAASTIRRADELKAPFLQCLKYFHTISLVELQGYIPPDSNDDYDMHLVQSVQGLKDLRRDVCADLFLSFSEDESSAIPPTRVGKDLEEAQYKCWYPSGSSASSMDQMARALVDASVFVAFLSNNYVQNEKCCNIYKYAKLTLNKPILVIAVGKDLNWKQSKLGILLSDLVFVNMQDGKLPSYKSKFEEVLSKLKEKIHGNLDSNLRHDDAPCFFSYCWANSASAVALGTKSSPSALGVADPRGIKEHIEKKGISCWIDVERIGSNGLFEDIAEGLHNAKIVVICVSDEYAASRSCAMEFRFASLVLNLPVILAVVGKGEMWRRTEIGLLSLGKGCPMVNFNQWSDEPYDVLCNLVKSFLPKDNEEAKKKKQRKNEQNQKQQNASFQELYELAQRKFFRQVKQYAEEQDTEPYPTLFQVDFVKDKTEVIAEPESQENAEEKESSEESKAEDKTFQTRRYCVSILCEHEEGWHSASEPIELDEDFAKSHLEEFAPYIARITAVLKHNMNMMMNCMAEKEGNFIKWLEGSPKVKDMTDFKQIYQNFRLLIMEADKEKKMGNLLRCQIPSGKTIWLCNKHQMQTGVTVLSNDVVTASPSSYSDTGVVYMLKALRELDYKRLSMFKHISKDSTDAQVIPPVSKRRSKQKIQIENLPVSEEKSSSKSNSQSSAEAPFQDTSMKTKDKAPTKVPPVMKRAGSRTSITSRTSVTSRASVTSKTSVTSRACSVM